MFFGTISFTVLTAHIQAQIPLTQNHKHYSAIGFNVQIVIEIRTSKSDSINIILLI